MKAKKLLFTIAIVCIALFSGCSKDDFPETTGICPVIISTIPLDKATGVPLNQVISATFNEAMNQATITNSSFTLMAGATSISGVISYSGNTASFTPSSPLAENTTYLARITTAVKDITGNALQVDYVWTFTTGLTLRPVVIATDPLNLETGVRLNKVISATFSMSMDPLTINASSFTVKQGTNVIAGTILSSGITTSFTPTIALTANTVYTCTITNAVKNSLGTTMLVNYVWSFTTSAAPTVISTDPLNNATGVDLNKTVTATFNMPMDAVTLVNPATTFTVKQGLVTIAGVVTYSGSTASFNPTVAFLSNKVYTATISTVAKNLAGVPMAANYVWSFTTGVPVTTTIPPVASGLTLGVFGGNAGVTNQGLLTKINNGSIATTAASTLVTGLKDGTTGDVYTVTPLNNGLVSGRIYAAAPAPGNAVSAAIATQGLIDATAAYLSISPASKPGGIDPGAGELGGLTLAPGLYKANSGTFKITKGDLTLDAQGDANAVWIFQTAAGLTVGDSAPSSVKLVGGAQAKNIYWYVGSTAVINYAGGGVMSGTIIANSGVTLSSPANNTAPAGQETVLNGKAISLVSSVTMVNTIINVQ